MTVITQPAGVTLAGSVDPTAALFEVGDSTLCVGLDDDGSIGFDINGLESVGLLPVDALGVAAALVQAIYEAFRLTT